MKHHVLWLWVPDRARYLTTRSLSSGRASRGPVGVARRSLVRDDSINLLRNYFPVAPPRDPPTTMPAAFSTVFIAEVKSDSGP